MSSLQSCVLCVCASNTTKFSSTLSPQSSMSSLGDKMSEVCHENSSFLDTTCVRGTKTQEKTRET